MAPKVSPFLHPGPVTTEGSLAVVHLSKDNLVPIYPVQSQGAHDGYAEGAVLNTRFGSFPHSTLLGVPWGSQVRASNVDTGSRGRLKLKRKRGAPGADDKEDSTAADSTAADSAFGLAPSNELQQPAKELVAAATGFIHILPPTPEIWTMSLPHRTQVVYTPDYSYILQKIRARPGTQIIEAGAGSGSFTHASARAVYSGYPVEGDAKPRGKVFSFEYHEERYRKMTVELRKHGLDGLVQLTHRDVYLDGFLVDGESPKADAVFLDLPAPWRALPHLARQRPRLALEADDAEMGDGSQCLDWVSPLDPKKSVYLCTFSPCIEQVTRTVSTMRKLGWVDIEMVEVANRRIMVNRDKIGLNLAQTKRMMQQPKDVGEAISRLRTIEDRFREHNKAMWEERNGTVMDVDDAVDGDVAEAVPGPQGSPMVEADAVAIPAPAKPWLEGQLVTRTEPEVKTHTSYLVFAVLPREWTDEDEAAALARWPVGNEKQTIGSLDKAARKAEKRQEFQKKRADKRAA